MLYIKGFEKLLKYITYTFRYCTKYVVDVNWKCSHSVMQLTTDKKIKFNLLFFLHRNILLQTKKMTEHFS